MNHIVGRCHLLGGAGYLLEVVFLVVGILLALELLLVDLGSVARGAALGGVGRGGSVLLVVALEREGVLVAAAPVVLELAVAPLLLEGGLALVFGSRVVEVPRLVGVEGVLRGSCRGTLVSIGAAGSVLLGQIFLALGVFGLFLFLFLELVDDFLYHLFLVGQGQLRQLEQRVLQGHVARVHRELVEHVAALLDFLVVGILLVDLRHGLAVAGLGQVILALGKVDTAQPELAYGLVDAVARALLGRRHIVFYGPGRVAAREIEVAYGIVYLVEILLVAVVAGHGLERLHLALDVLALEHGTLLDARIELGAVGRAHAAAGPLVGLVGQLILPRFLIELPQQEVEPHLLPAVLPVQRSAQVGNGLGIFLVLDVVVGKGQVGQRQQPLVVNLVDVHVGKHVVGLGGPAHGAVAQGLPQVALELQLGLPGEVAGDVVKGGTAAQEVALHVLGLGQHVPGVVQKRVVLVALHPLLVLGVVLLAGFLLGLLLDGVQRDGFLHLLDCAVKRAAGLRRLGVLVGFGRVNEQALRVVVLVVVLQQFYLLVVVGHAVVVHVVARVERLPKARAGRVFLGAARAQQHGRNGQPQYVSPRFPHEDIILLTSRLCILLPAHLRQRATA